MPCLSLGLRLPLPPARRAWKIFTSKLQKKLPIFRLISKPTRNHHRILGAAGSGSRTTSTFRVQNKKLIRHHPQQSRRRLLSQNPPRRFQFKKRHAAPVFVDKLYYNEAPEKLINFVDKTAAAGTSGVILAPPNKEEPGRRSPCLADDMWESVALASPQMHEINERAEEFITKFRAHMLHQETMAKDL